MTSRRTGHFNVSTLEKVTGAFALALSVAALPACNPYQNFSGEYYAGPIDPTDFAPAYVGVLPGSADQSGGTIAASYGSSSGKTLYYYLFPFSADESSQSDPLSINTGAAPAPKGFVFDPTMTSPFADPNKCVAPKGYMYDQRTDAYHKDEQGVIFGSIPSDPDYAPVIQETVVTSNGEACQYIKSKKTLISGRKDVMVSDTADGKYLAFAEIDPAANVTPNQADGLGPIHLGWYNQFMIAFIDGGYIPTEDVAPAGTVNAYTRMKAQTLYAPTAIPGLDGSMNPVGVAGGVGTGYDILEAKRGDANYSPVCHVISYQPDDPLHPKTDAADLSDAELQSTGLADSDQGYIFCLQPF